MTKGVAVEIDRALSATRILGSRNAISTADLRDWVVEYLAEKDQEFARFPELVAMPHWNLWMTDAELDNALFATLVFERNGVRAMFGTGNSFDIRSWANDNSADPSELEAELRRNFQMPEAAVSIGQPDAVAWLGRSW